MKARTAAMVSKSSGSAIASVRTLIRAARREGAALAQEAVRQAFDFGRGGRSAIERDQRDTELIGERGEHVALGDEAHIDQDLAELIAALLLQFERALEILRLDLAALDQDLAEPQVPRSERRCVGGIGRGIGLRGEGGGH